MDNNLCEYGCGGPATHKLKNNKYCCGSRPAKCSFQKQKISEATKKAYTNGRKKAIYSGFSQEIKDKMAWSRGKSLISNDVVFIENSGYSNEMIKERIIKDGLLEYKCVKCGITDSWQGDLIILDLDHIDGNSQNHKLSNLRFLCPNCHSQTETYKGRNKNSGKIKVSDDDLLTAYQKNGNIRKALISVGLAAKGGNYARLKRLIRASLGM